MQLKGDLSKETKTNILDYTCGLDKLMVRGAGTDDKAVSKEKSLMPRHHVLLFEIRKGIWKLIDDADFFCYGF